MSICLWKKNDNEQWSISIPVEVQNKWETFTGTSWENLDFTNVEWWVRSGNLTSSDEKTAHTFEVSKIKLIKGSKKREIYAPRDDTKHLLKSLLPMLFHDFKKIETNKYAYGFIPNRSCTEQAKEHIGYDFTISLDIKDFFHNVSSKLVKGIIDDDLMPILFLGGRLKQGFPTSPMISNIAFNLIDIKIDAYLQSTLGVDVNMWESKKINLNYKYTRYADDLSISFNSYQKKDSIIYGIQRILFSHGFELNHAKTKFLDSRNGRRIICGVGVDSRNIYPTRRTLKKMRAAIHQGHFSSLLGLRSWVYSIEKNSPP